MINNSYIQNSISTILINIKNGSSIAKAFEDTNLFDDFTIRLLYMAQYTNNYELILNDISNYYKERFKKSMKDLSSVLSPILVFIIALIVLWIVLAIMLPIWQMNATLGL
jgi:general secretion pathway protein F